MRFFLRSFISCRAALAPLGLGAVFAAICYGETTGHQHLPKEKLVEETLRREAQEAIEDRSELLRPALIPGRVCESAYWQSGYVFDAKHKKWLPLDEAEKAAGKDARLKVYASLRVTHGDTISAHLEMARWCLGQGLEEQAHAHLLRVIELNPNQVDARQMLGYRLSKGSWVSEQELADAQSKVRRAAIDLAKWKPKLEALRSRMQTASRTLQKKRRSDLEAIHDPAAAGAIDAVFCSRGGDDMTLGISLLENLPSAESAAILARYATFAPWETVGKSAAQALRSQQKHDYVPLLLAGMESQDYSRAEIYQKRGSSQSYYRQIFYGGGDSGSLAMAQPPRPSGNRFGGSAQTMPVSAAGLSNVGLSNVGLDNAGLDDAGLKTVMQSVEREAGSSSAKSATSMLLRRLSTVLQEATGEKGKTTAADWWRWWYDENDCLPPLVNYRPGYEEASLNRWDPSPPKEVVPVEPSRRPCECFAAGTIVWTETGPVAVEKIAMGDRVFACDPETGCLALKVVLRPTVRPPTTLFKIRLEGEELRSTGGHCFWVSGKGWVMARDMRVGMNVHTIRGTATVASVVADTKQEPAYNLVVEGFHSYFVGQGKYLTHDNTIRQPTDRVVPGLAASK